MNFQNRHGIFSTHIYYARVIQKADLNWISTDEEVAIKRVSWQCIRASQNRLSEDFIKEIAALTYLSDFLDGTSMADAHILTANIVMSDESYLYVVMPYCNGGDICMRVALAEEYRLSEADARTYFTQLLKVRASPTLCAPIDSSSMRYHADGMHVLYLFYIPIGARDLAAGKDMSQGPIA